MRLIKQLLVENGPYLALCDLGMRVLDKARNTFIAKKLGTEKIYIGPSSLIRGLSHIKIGSNFIAGRGLWLEAVTNYGEQAFSPNILIGNNVHISNWTHIGAVNFVRIGDNALIGSKVIITDHNHGCYSGPHTSPLIPPHLRPLDTNKEVSIGRNVWLGDNVVVMPGVSIGDGAIIGASSVVTTSIAEYTIAVGIPAKPIRKYDFTIEQWISVV